MKLPETTLEGSPCASFRRFSKSLWLSVTLAEEEGRKSVAKALEGVGSF